LALGFAGPAIDLVQALADLGGDALAEVDLPRSVLVDENDRLELVRRGRSAHAGSFTFDGDPELVLSGYELSEHESAKRLVVLSLPV
jgi:hypothetical protein